MNLEQRVNIGILAKEFVELFKNLVYESKSYTYKECHVISLTEDEQDYLLQRISELLNTKQAESTEEEMTIHQFQIFREVVMPFGVHRETKIKDIPESYLCNILDPSPFMKKLQLYVSYLQRRSGE